MALSVAEIETLITDMEHQYNALSREYSETLKGEVRDEISDTLSSIGYQIARLEEQWLELRQQQPRAVAAGA